MPGFLLNQASVVLCLHAGAAQPAAVAARVLVDGAPAVTLLDPWTIAGCPFVPPAAGPCASAQWVTGATRVQAGGAPLLLQDGVAVCAPTGTGLNVVFTQARVRGQ